MMTDILTRLAQQQEQQEAAVKGMARLYTITFNELVGNGMTREESLEMTKSVMSDLMRLASMGKNDD